MKENNLLRKIIDKKIVWYIAVFSIISVRCWKNIILRLGHPPPSQCNGQHSWPCPSQVERELISASLIWPSQGRRDRKVISTLQQHCSAWLRKLCRGHSWTNLLSDWIKAKQTYRFLKITGLKLYPTRTFELRLFQTLRSIQYRWSALRTLLQLYGA